MESGEILLTLVCGLSQSGEGDAAIECGEAFFPDDGIDGVAGVTIPRYLEGISEGVLLRLQSDLDDFHRSDDSDRFRGTGSKTRLRRQRT
jgi:hypothetical protein